MAPPPDHTAYWRANLRLVAILVSIWFLVSYVFGILLVEALNCHKSFIQFKKIFHLDLFDRH